MWIAYGNSGISNVRTVWRKPAVTTGNPAHVRELRIVISRYNILLSQTICLNETENAVLQRIVLSPQYSP